MNEVSGVVKVGTKKKTNWANISLGIGIFLVSIFLLLFIGSYFYPRSPEEMDLANKFQKPSTQYLLGTDQFGRDILARIMHSMRSVFSVGVGAVLLGAVVGTLIGLVAGMAPKWLERILMSTIDGLVAFPGILLAMLVVFILGKGVKNTIIAIGIMMIPVYAKLAYSTVIEESNKLHIKAAKSYGLNGAKLVTRHIMPVLLPKIVTQFSTSVASAIMTESSLSFLGLGVQPPSASLGLMLKEAQQTVLLYPYTIIPPGVSLVIVILGFVLIADAVSDKLSRRRGD